MVPFNILVVPTFSSSRPKPVVTDRYEGDHPALAPLARGGRLLVGHGEDHMLVIVAILDDPRLEGGAWVAARKSTVAPFQIMRPSSIPEPRLSLEEVIAAPVELSSTEMLEVMETARTHGYTHEVRSKQVAPADAQRPAARARTFKATHASGEARRLTVMPAVGGGSVVLYNAGPHEPEWVALSRPLGDDDDAIREVDLQNGQRDELRAEAVVDEHVVARAIEAFKASAERAADVSWADVENVWC